MVYINNGKEIPTKISTAVIWKNEEEALREENVEFRETNIRII